LKSEGTGEPRRTMILIVKLQPEGKAENQPTTTAACSPTMTTLGSETPGTDSGGSSGLWSREGRAWSTSVVAIVVGIGVRAQGASSSCLVCDCRPTPWTEMSEQLVPVRDVIVVHSRAAADIGVDGARPRLIDVAAVGP
jgi:hypothetical protein